MDTSPLWKCRSDRAPRNPPYARAVVCPGRPWERQGCLSVPRGRLSLTVRHSTFFGSLAPCAQPASVGLALWEPCPCLAGALALVLATLPHHTFGYFVIGAPLKWWHLPLLDIGRLSSFGELAQQVVLSPTTDNLATSSQRPSVAAAPSCRDPVCLASPGQARPGQATGRGSRHSFADVGVGPSRGHCLELVVPSEPWKSTTNSQSQRQPFSTLLSAQS